MAKFKIICHDGKVLEYDNQTSVLSGYNKLVRPQEFQAFDMDTSKSNDLSVVKIQLGLNCNYSCDYCSQRFVPHAGQTNPDDIQPFLDKLPSWLKPSSQVRFEFWGGEPFVYWKTLKPLAEALRKLYPYCRMSLITNGSLLDIEKNEWIDKIGLGISISHDGPGQHVRGPDPLNDLIARDAILDLYSRLAPQGRISFGSMVNRWNTSRAAIQEFFVKLTGDKNVRIGEGAFIDPYDEGGKSSSIQSQEEAIAFRRQAINELRQGKVTNFDIATNKIQGFVRSIETARPASALGQKCGMDRKDRIAVDLNGNVLTCQNVSAVATAPNGRSHKIGSIDDFESINLDTTTHWSQRQECGNCPVLQLCQGSCMFLQDEMFELGCNNSFNDNIVFFAAAIEYMAGSLPIRIEGPQRSDRVDLWGSTVAPRKVIAIKEIKNG